MLSEGKPTLEEPTTMTEESILDGTVEFKRITQEKDFQPGEMIKVITWNVSGLRAVLKKGTELRDLMQKESPDLLCLQETKLSDREEGSTLGVVDGYTFFDSISVTKKGYSGTRTYVKYGIAVQHIPGFDISEPKQDDEGRIITTVVNGEFVLLNSYVPNAGMMLDRLPHRVDDFDPMMRSYIQSVVSSMKLPVVWTGDLNVAERDYDRFFSSNFKQMETVAGFTPEERASFRETLEKTSTFDAFQKLYPNTSKVYSFWSARFNRREKNEGWRLDYFVLSNSLESHLVDTFMLPQYTTSDHCPVVLWLKKK